MKTYIRTAAVVIFALIVGLFGTMMVYAESDYPGNDGFTSGKPLQVIDAAGEDEGILAETAEETTYIPETRSPEEQESINTLMESLDAQYGTQEQDKEGAPGTVQVVLRDETEEKSILLVLYDDRNKRREIVLNEDISYACSVKLPSGTYNVIGAYPMAEGSKVKFYTNTDRFTLDANGTYLLEIGVVEEESMEISQTIPEIKGTEGETIPGEDIEKVPEQKQNHGVLIVILLSVMMGIGVIAVCIKRNRH